MKHQKELNEKYGALTVLNPSTKLNDKWLKASVIGTVWAASEIVLGSFLHNLKIPMAGSILTAIGLIILISVSHIWKDKGIFWRAGLICALMKTMSPSAVIFGPMIAIFSEALLFEFSVRILGRTYSGYFLGAILAVSWNLVQRIANFLIFYGFDIVELYKSLMKFTEKQLSLQFDTLWLPILLLLSVYVVVGIISAILGIKTGKKLRQSEEESHTKNYDNLNLLKKNKETFQYSLAWLFLNLGFIVSGLIAIELTPWQVWVPGTVGIVVIWSMKYKRALRQLMKPKFWIFFVLITMLTALAFSRMQGSTSSLSDAILIGIQMNFRAIVLILGFSVLGTELYNPKIRDFFNRTAFKQLLPALELSTESLPMVISGIPDFKTLIKNPISVIHGLVANAEQHFSELKSKQNFQPKVFIISGGLDSGKSRFVSELIRVLNEKGISVSGIFSRKLFTGETVLGYDVVEIQTDESAVFLRDNTDTGLDKIGRFNIYPEGISKGEQALNPDNCAKNGVVIIDEAGRLELRQKGWAKSISQVVERGQSHVIIVVRDEFVSKFQQIFQLPGAIVIEHFPEKEEEMLSRILAKIQSEK